MLLQLILVLVLALAKCTVAQDDRLYSYICLSAQDQLCLGISADGDPVYNSRSLYYVQVKHREKVEIRQEDHLRTRWSIIPSAGVIQLTNFTSLCLSKRIATTATPGDLVLRPCGTTGDLENWNLLTLVQPDNTIGSTIRRASAPGQCVTMMACDRTGGFCSRTTANVYTGAIPKAVAQRGAYVKMMPCSDRYKLAQTWTQAIDCAPGCSPFMINGPNNTCDAACANDACNWDNGACATARPTPPTFRPTLSPTVTAPSLSPSQQPTSSSPSASPSTPIPSESPSLAPTTSFPTRNPTPEPTTTGTKVPTTLRPTTHAPSRAPTLLPSASPVPETTVVPTLQPSAAPIPPTAPPTPVTTNPRGDTNAPSTSPTTPSNSSDLSSGSAGVGRRLWYVWLIIAVILLLLLIMLCCFCFCVPAKKKKKDKKQEGKQLSEDEPAGIGAAAAASVDAKHKDIESQAVKRPNADVNEIAIEDDEPAKKKVPVPAASIEGLGGGNAAEEPPIEDTQVADPGFAQPEEPQNNGPAEGAAPGARSDAGAHHPQPITHH